MDTIATLKARITADTGDFKAKMADVDRTLQRTGGTAKGTAGGFDLAGGKLLAMAGGTAAVGAALVKGVNVAADFEEAMDAVAAKTGLSGKELEKVSDFALEMGAKTKFGGQEAAEGLMELLASGQDVKEAMASLGPAMNLAAIEGLDLKTTADGLTNILAMFGLKAGDAAKVAQIFAAASSESSAGVADLIEGFGNVGPIAKQFGLGVSDTAAILAVFADNGIKGAEAGTQLKSLLTNMNSDNAKKALDDLGISLYDNKGKVRDFRDVLDDLRGKIGTMTDEEKNALIKELGGAFGQLGLSALLAGPAVDQMADKMAKARDIADVAADRTDNFKGKMESLGGSLEGLATKTMTPIINEVLNPMADALIELVNGVTKGDLDGIAAGLVGIGEALAGIPVKIAQDLVAKLEAMAGLGKTGMGTTMGDQSDIANQGQQRQYAANLASKTQGYTPQGGLLGGMSYEQWLAAIQNGTSFVAGGAPMGRAAQMYQAGGPDFLLEIKQTAMEIDKLNQAFGRYTERVEKPAESTLSRRNRGMAEIEQVGIEPGPLFKQIWDEGIPMEATFAQMAARGMIPEESLRTLMLNGITPGDSLVTLIDKGFVPSEDLRAILADKTLDLTAEAKAMLQRGIDVRIQLTVPNGRMDGRAESRDSGGMGRAGRPYLIGVGAQPELFVPDTAGRFYPAGSYGGGGNVTINVYTNDPMRVVRVVDQEMRRQNRM